jgi:Domain of unknown function (DUF4262)
MGDLPQPQDHVDTKALADIASCGWHVIKIQEEAGTSGWAFSVGLYHSFGHPEVAIFGLPLSAMHAIINVVGERVASGEKFAGATVASGIVKRYDCAFRDVAKRWYRPFFGYARWLYRGDDFPMVQCLWPDREGRLPDDPRCHAGVLGAQPRLDLETEEAAGVRDLLRSMERESEP